MKPENNKIKYIIYVRKSSEENNRQILSLDSQADVLSELAKRDNLHVVETLREARSAKEPYKRPIFAEMIKQIDAGKADGIIAWKIDRLARNPVEEGQIKWLLQTGKIQRIRTPERDYRPEDNTLIASVEFGMANQYIRDLSTNVKRGLWSKAERGLFPTFAPIGYLNNPHDPKGHKQITKDPERFDMIRKIFDLVLEQHKTPIDVFRIASKKWKLTNAKGRPISRSTVYRILTNPLYSGVFEYPVGSGRWFQGKHEAIITTDEYDKIQVILGKKGKPRPKSHVFAFTGLMKCGNCGASITAEEKIKKQKNGNIHRYVYYRCTKKLNPRCAEKCLREEELIKQIHEELDKINITPHFHSWAMNSLRRSILKNVGLKSKITQSKQRKADDVEKQLANILNLVSRGTISEEDYLYKKAELSKEKAQLGTLPNNKINRVQLIMEKGAECFDLCRDAKEEFEKAKANHDFQKQRRMVVKLGSNPSLKDRIFDICIGKPLLIMQTISKELKDIHKRLEPVKIPLNTREMDVLYSKNLILRREWDLNPRDSFES